MTTEQQPGFKHTTRARLPTEFGEFELFLFVDPDNGKEHMALVRGNIENQKGLLVRLHSECLTGDVFASLRCDCGQQLQSSLKMIANEGAGVLVYLRQEGRGIGLVNKMKAYNLQDEGYDTVEANLMLGHLADERDYTVAGNILKSLGVHSVRLLSNNPRKAAALELAHIEVVERVGLQPLVNAENAKYLRTKIQKLSHSFKLSAVAEAVADKNENAAEIADNAKQKKD